MEPRQLLAAATQLVTEARFGSPSMIMRNLSQQHGEWITFTAAVELLDQMEAAGIVGAAHGSRARAVLMDPEAAAEAIAQRTTPATPEAPRA